MGGLLLMRRSCIVCTRFISPADALALSSALTCTIACIDLETGKGRTSAQNCIYLTCANFGGLSTLSATAMGPPPPPAPPPTPDDDPPSPDAAAAAANDAAEAPPRGGNLNPAAAPPKRPPLPPPRAAVASKRSEAKVDLILVGRIRGAVGIGWGSSVLGGSGCGRIPPPFRFS